MKRLSGFILFAVFAALYFGCKPAPVFPDEPVLTFKEFIQSGDPDSLRVVFSFTDGDGDIGIAPNSSDSNMVLTLYHKNATGNWVIIDDNSTAQSDSICYSYRIPKLTAGQNGLEGDIYLTLNKQLLVATGEDTLQFNAFLLDQSHHRSNYVRTPECDLIH